MLVVGLFAYAAVPLADTLMLRWFVRDLDIRSSLIATTVQEPLDRTDRDRLDAAHRAVLPTG